MIKDRWWPVCAKAAGEGGIHGGRQGSGHCRRSFEAGRVPHQLQRPAPAARAARGVRRGRSLLLLLRRALRRRLSDRHRHPALHPRDPHRQPDRRGRDDLLSRTSSAACAPASARPRRCARKPACARSPRASRSGSASCSATPPTSLMRGRRAPLRARAARPASASPSSAAARPASPAPIACAMLRPRRRHLRRAAEGRRPQRIRHRRLQGSRRLRRSARSISSCRSAASTSRPARRSAATSRSANCARTSTPSSSAIGLGGVNALGLCRRGHAPASRTRSTTSPSSPGEGSRHAAGRPPRRGGRRRHDRHRHRHPVEAARRRGRHHRLPPRPRADGRQPLRARTGPDRRRHHPLQRAADRRSPS